jgi:hypothetical protein
LFFLQEEGKIRNLTFLLDTTVLNSHKKNKAMAKESSIYDKIEQHLFKSKEDALVSLTERENKIRERIMLSVAKLLEDPLMPDKDLVSFLRRGCGGLTDIISQTQAYRDVAAITKIVGNIRLSSKDWYRHMIIEGAKEGYIIAVANKDSKGVAANIDKIGKYTRADKDDEIFDWSQMIPPNWEPTDDISVLDGMEPIPDLEAHRKEFRALFKGKVLETATDAQEVDE